MERVVCVDDTLPPWGYFNGDPLVSGRIYTVRGEVTDNYGVEGFLLYEARLNERRWGLSGDELGYLKSRFRPIDDSRIDIFRQIDREVFDKEPANVWPDKTPGSRQSSTGGINQ